MDKFREAFNTQKLSLPVKDKRIEALILWRDPKKTALFLGACTIAYMALNQIASNPVVVLCNLLQFVVIVSFLWSVIASLLKKPGVPVPAVLQNGLTETQVKDFATRATVHVNKILGFFYRVLTGKDVVLSLQTAGGLYVIAKIASVVSPFTFMYIALIVLFIVPKLYEIKKDEIDHGLATAHGHYKKLHDKHVDPLLKRIPRASTATSKSATSTFDTSSVINQVKEAAEEVSSAVKAE